MLLLLPILLLGEMVSGAVVCPDQTERPDGTTCCLMKNDKYGYCPVPEGVCCSDHQHCCPKGYTCNNATCEKRSLSIPYINLERLIASNSNESHSTKVICDAIHYCQGGNTCCRTQIGEWACCGHPQAVCCANGLNCCPNGYTCDITASICTRNGRKLPMETKKPAQKIISLSTSVSSDTSSIMCDRVYSCPNGYTCCRQDTGRWTCCSHPATVCCGTKCCPQDFSNLFSTSSSLRVPLMRKKPAMEIKALSLRVNSDGSVIYCDKLHYCSAENTCCRLPSGSWGCCPIPSATFCNDGVHCCPYGMNCDAANSFCTVGSICIPWLNIKPALIASDAITNVGSDSSVVNCDKTYFCKAGMTCCSAAKGKWGCCPFPNGQCCEDKQTCCPKHYRCSGGPKKMTCRWKIWSQIPSVENTEEFENF